MKNIPFFVLLPNHQFSLHILEEPVPYTDVFLNDSSH